MSKKIFINYRRSDTTPLTALLIYKEFAKDVPPDNLFMDVENLNPGEDFPTVLKRWVDECDIFLVLIGNGWIDAKCEKTGRRRLELEDDFVRLEISQALKRDIKIVPVMLEGARVPETDKLPDDLKELTSKQVQIVSNHSFDHDINDLKKKLGLTSAQPAAKKSGLEFLEFDFSGVAKSMQKLSQLRDQEVVIKAPFIHGAENSAFLPGGGLTAWFKDFEQGPEMVIIPEWTQEKDQEEMFHAPLASNARPFAVSRHEITFAQWDAAYQAGGVSSRPADEGWGRGQRPVINVSWQDAVNYTNWLSLKTGQTYRLLSEAEWTFCCRAGKTAMFSGQEIDLRKHAHFLDLDTDEELGVQEVGQLEPNAFGIYDMLGNSWEWCRDCWRDEPPRRFTSLVPFEEAGCSQRVARGGGWSSGVETIMTADREGFDAGQGRRFLGLRVARTIKQ